MHSNFFKKKPEERTEIKAEAKIIENELLDFKFHIQGQSFNLLTDFAAIESGLRDQVLKLFDAVYAPEPLRYLMKLQELYDNQSNPSKFDELLLSFRNTFLNMKHKYGLNETAYSAKGLKKIQEKIDHGEVKTFDDLTYTGDGGKEEHVADSAKKFMIKTLNYGRGDGELTLAQQIQEIDLTPYIAYQEKMQDVSFQLTLCDALAELKDCKVLLETRLSNDELNKIPTIKNLFALEKQISHLLFNQSTDMNPNQIKKELDSYLKQVIQIYSKCFEPEVSTVSDILDNTCNQLMNKFKNPVVFDNQIMKLPPNEYKSLLQQRSTGQLENKPESPRP